MPLILHKDPILEAVCSFSLDAPDWDLTVPGLVYNKIRNDYPRKADAPQFHFKVEETSEGVTPSVETQLGRIQFWGKNNQTLVQIGPGHLSIHQLKPYSNWSEFKKQIEAVLRHYEEAAPFRAINAISLRYINRLPWPQERVQIQDVLRVVPQIPDSDNQIWTSWFQQVQILKPEFRAGLTVGAGSVPTQVDGTSSAMLDLSFGHIEGEPIQRNSVSSWLEIAHTEIERMFLTSLQEEYLQRFNPEVVNE
ncbi:hypothetical protein IAD21_01231 [Abditibacteriota bacterium]|nr:hypothetical protein IAD21_01231 [Abditibacteriota bacterium]